MIIKHDEELSKIRLVQSNVKLSAHVISNLSESVELEKDLDFFINKWATNPFLLSGFANQFMRSNRMKCRTPFILVINADKKTVAVAPLMTRKRLGMFFVDFFSSRFLPDFVASDRYREACMKCVIDYLFEVLNCRFAEFDLPAESPNLQALRRQCKVFGINFRAKTQLGHRILPVNCTWERFQELKGSHWRKGLKRMERKLDQIGSWRIVSVKDVSNRPDILERILNVERMSWKESWRGKIQMTIDKDLLVIWEGSQRPARIESDFKCSVWFLEVNSETAAYALVIKYKGTAFLAKTSFDNRYRKFYIGKLLCTMLIRDLFTEGQIKTIDFMTDLPFMSAWASSSLNRVTVLMWKGKILTLAEKIISNACVSKVLRSILDSLSKRLSFLGSIHLY